VSEKNKVASRLHAGEVTLFPKRLVLIYVGTTIILCRVSEFLRLRLGNLQVVFRRESVLWEFTKNTLLL